MIVLIDNYDSFTHNLARYIKRACSIDIKIIRNDQATVSDIKALDPCHLVISPGPGSPTDAGISLACIDYFYQDVPILGICLGHQAIAQYFGANIVTATQILHGKISKVDHQQDNLFTGVESPFIAARYHSLAIQKDSLPACLCSIAQTEENEIMAIKHKTLPIYGLQFHPEAFLTEHGQTMIHNFFKITSRDPKGDIMKTPLI